MDADLDVDTYDIVLMSWSYGSVQGDGEFTPNCDVDGNGDIHIYDVVIACENCG